MNSVMVKTLTLTELVALVLPEVDPDTPVEIRISDPASGKSWFLGSFGTELCFSYPEETGTAPTDPPGPRPSATVVPLHPSGSKR